MTPRQIILATEVTTEANDVRQLQPMLAKTAGDDLALAFILAHLGWGSGDQAHAAALLRGATWFALAEADQAIVGYAHALSDRVSVTYLAEVGVSPGHRGRGIGSALLDAVVREFGGTALYASASPEILPLLARYGIRERPGYHVATARGPQA